MIEATSFTEKFPPSDSYVIVENAMWPQPRVLLFQEVGAFGAPWLLDEREGRWYWYPERMAWRPATEQAGAA